MARHFSIIKEGGAKQIMLTRFEHTDGKGLHGLAGFIELDHKTPEQTAVLILERLALNEGLFRDYYAGPAPDLGSTPRADIPHNLPSLQPFFGRAEELKKIAAALHPKSRSWGTLIDGEGGRGKTSLAIRAACEVPAKHFERIVFVSAKRAQQHDDRVRDVAAFAHATWADILAKIARVLDLTAVMQAIEAERPRLLAEALESRRILLVLDNLETLSDADQDQLFAFLDHLPPGCKALLTSRRFVGNNIYALDLEPLDQPTALRLLEEISAHNEAFARSREDERIGLWQATKGNALLLRWVAGQVGRGSCTSIGDALAHLRSCPPGNNPLEFIFGDVVATLSDGEVALLAVLTHPTQPIRVEDAAGIGGVAVEEARSVLKALTNRALVTAHERETRFALVPMVADFLRKKKPDVVTEAGDRLEKHAYALMVENGYEKHDSFPVLEAAWPTVAAALPRFLVGKNDQLQEVCSALIHFLNFTGRWDEWLALSRDAEARAVAEKDLLKAGWRVYHAGMIHCLRRQSAEVLSCADRAEAHWRAAQAGAREQAIAIRLRGLGHELAQDYSAAVTDYRESVNLLRTLRRESLDIAIGLSDLADVERFSGDFGAAEHNYCEALRIARTVGDNEDIAIYIGNLAALELDRGGWVSAEALARESLPLAEKVGRLDVIAINSNHLAKALVKQGKKEEALPHAQRAVRIFETLSHPNLTAARQILAECKI